MPRGYADAKDTGDTRTAALIAIAAAGAWRHRTPSRCPTMVRQPGQDRARLDPFFTTKAAGVGTASPAVRAPDRDGGRHDRGHDGLRVRRWFRVDLNATDHGPVRR
jgi:hypothetical protein